MKKPLLGMTLSELQEVVTSLSMPRFTANQIAEWIYQKQINNIDEMTSLSKANREKLGSSYYIGKSPACQRSESNDGTIKYLFPTLNGHTIETVYIPEGERATLCVSCQVGCKMNCLFCQTGKQGWQGNLTTTDILNQVFSCDYPSNLTNVVFMGQGEPLDNYDAVLHTIEILTASYGLQWSPKRITVSTVGIRKTLKQFLDNSQCHLAVSLHSAIHELREQLMPAEKLFPITDIVELIRTYDWSHQRRITFEYTMFGGLNDSQLHARELVRLLNGIQCRVNLIRWHKIPDVQLNEVDDSRMKVFRDYLNNHGITATIRTSRGQDIFAACGMLKSQNNEN